MTVHRTSAAVVVAVVLGWGTVGPAGADNAASAEADHRLRVGLAHYEGRQYQRAIREFRAGYAIEPRREFLYALGQAERLSGDCASAVVYYRRFLSRNPPERQQRAARNHLQACEEALSSGPAASRGDRQVTKRSVPAPAAALRVTAAGEPPTSPWYRDPTGNLLLGGGAALALTSAGFLLAASGAAGDARGADNYPVFDDRVRRARRLRTVGLVIGAVSAGLVGGAIYSYRRSERRAALAVAPLSGGGLAVVTGSF